MKTITQKLQRTIAGMFLALGIVSFASFAHAAKPHTDVIDETFIDDFLSDFCGFPVQVHVEATFIVSERGNAISVSGPYKVTWTNLETGESATGNSPVHIQQVATFGDEFIVLDVVNSGPFLVKGPHGGAAWIVAGHFRRFYQDEVTSAFAPGSVRHWFGGSPGRIHRDHSNCLRGSPDTTTRKYSVG